MPSPGFNRLAPVYATVDDLEACGPPPVALRAVGPDEKRRALYQACRKADTRLAARYKLPLVRWGDDLIQIVCSIATFYLLTYRGWNPQDTANAGIVTLYQDALKTLDQVAQGNATLDVQDTEPEPIVNPDMWSEPPRGM